MEKLIELLNEYTNKRPLYISMSEPYKGVYLQYDENFTVDIISKQFGFIKRLLDKEKINIIDEWNDYEKTNLYCDSDFFQLQKHYSYYESLLMLLAIKDEPVKFLSEILK